MTRWVINLNVSNNQRKVREFIIFIKLGRLCHRGNLMPENLRLVNDNSMPRNFSRTWHDMTWHESMPTFPTPRYRLWLISDFCLLSIPCLNYFIVTCWVKNFYLFKYFFSVIYQTITFIRIEESKTDFWFFFQITMREDELFQRPDFDDQVRTFLAFFFQFRLS